MKEQFTVVTRKGQITVPVGVRRALDLHEGDKVAISVADGDTARAILRPVRSVAAMTFGSVTPRKRPEDLEELRAIAQEEIAQRSGPQPTSEKSARTRTR